MDLDYKKNGMYQKADQASRGGWRQVLPSTVPEVTPVQRSAEVQANVMEVPEVILVPAHRRDPNVQADAKKADRIPITTLPDAVAPAKPPVPTLPPGGIVPPAGTLPAPLPPIPIEVPVEESCGYCITPAMAYVPTQKWSTTYEAEEGMSCGTIFPELDKPFLGEEAQY